MSLTQEILFNKFEIIECFKKDEHTGVYLANHIYLNKKIILKVLNTATIQDSVVTHRFKREAQLLAKLNHPNIINVLDFGMHDDYFYISFEYFEGTSLRAVLKKNKLSNETKEHLLVQMLKGFECAHSHGIIHRDIKPENIFINDKNELKIGDFGLAFDLTDNFVTGQYTIVGTPCYMSPEQINGHKITAQSDLFSLGIVAFELFTCNNPFLGSDINDTINKVISFKEETLHEKLDDLPNHISEIIKGLLQKKPAQRFSSVKEVLSLLNIEPEKHGGGSLKSKKTTAIVLVVLVLAAATLIIVFVIPQKETPEPAANSAQQKVDTSQGYVDADSVTVFPESTEPDIAQATPPREVEPNRNNVVTDGKTILAIQYGKLNIECFPWAKVIIDSKEIDTTPLPGDLTLTEGNHELMLYNPSYPPYVEQIKILQDELTNIRVNLDTLFGYVDFRIYPWGEIYLNEKLIGQTPLLQPLKLTPGKYRAEVKNPKAEPKGFNIIINRNDTLVVSHSFDIK